LRIGIFSLERVKNVGEQTELLSVNERIFIYYIYESVSLGERNENESKERNNSKLRLLMIHYLSTEMRCIIENIRVSESKSE
jgi:hypothetical protein